MHGHMNVKLPNNSRNIRCQRPCFQLLCSSTSLVSLAYGTKNWKKQEF